MTTPTDRRIAQLKLQYNTAAEGFARLGLKWGKVWMPSVEDLDRAIQEVERELEPG